VTVAGIQTHLTAFNTIAQQNGGIRGSLDATHTAAANYVSSTLAAAGFNVTVQTFQFDFGGDLTPPEFSRISPNPRTFVPVRDFNTMTYSGSGEVTAVVHPVDLEIPSIGGNTSGCEASDFAGFPAGAIALIQRSTCSFRTKALNAANAGAAGVIIMNEGNTPERRLNYGGSLTAPSLNIPVIATSYDIGLELVGSPGTVVRIEVNAASTPVTSSNVIAETGDGDPNNVVVIGASLDGRFGPAINATSGAAGLLEIARVFGTQDRASKNRMRFIWFGAHPEGFAGASYFVSQLSAAEQAKIRAMIEIGPIGSPNFGRFVFDGDQAGSVFSLPPNPAVDGASGTIETLFNDYFANSQLAVSSAGWPMNARPFREAGVPVGGIMSGLSDLKTAGQASVFGGTAGVAFDPCLSLACDGLANISTTSLDQLSDAAAHIVLMLSRRDFVAQPLVQN
jgi:Zn-dependent M28 family amino/carboxypeptidase